MIELIETDDAGVTLENIGIKIRLIRERKGWSRPRLSRESCIALPTIVNAEVGGRYPRLDTLVQILGAMDYEFVIREKP